MKFNITNNEEFEQFVKEKKPILSSSSGLAYTVAGVGLQISESHVPGQTECTLFLKCEYQGGVDPFCIEKFTVKYEVVEDNERE